MLILVAVKSIWEVSIFVLLYKRDWLKKHFAYWKHAAHIIVVYILSSYVKKKTIYQTYHSKNVCSHQISWIKNCTPVHNKILLQYIQRLNIIIVTAIEKYNDKITIKQKKYVDKYIKYRYKTLLCIKSNFLLLWRVVYNISFNFYINISVKGGILTSNNM